MVGGNRSMHMMFLQGWGFAPFQPGLTPYGTHLGYRPKFPTKGYASHIPKVYPS